MTLLDRSLATVGFVALVTMAWGVVIDSPRSRRVAGGAVLLGGLIAAYYALSAIWGGL